MNKETLYKGIGYEIHKVTDCNKPPIYELFSVNFQTVKSTSYDYKVILQDYLKKLIEGAYLLKIMKNDKYKELEIEQKKVEQEIKKIK